MGCGLGLGPWVGEGPPHGGGWLRAEREALEELEWRHAAQMAEEKPGTGGGVGGLGRLLGGS